MISEPVCDAIIAQIQSDEGGVADVRDGAGLTHYGQTEPWLNEWGLPVPTSPEMAAQNWRRWMAKTGLEQLTGIDQPTAHAVIDWAVMSGPSTPIRALQQAVRAKQDGLLGKDTLTAFAHADARRVAHVVLEQRRSAYLALVIARPFDTPQGPGRLKFLAGWNARITRELAEVHGITF